MSKIEQEVENLVKGPIENLGYQVYDVMYRKEAQNYYLTIFIDHEKGISIDDCEKVNNEINDLLDEKDLIKEPYFLEISSPGLERILRKEQHFINYIGKEIYVKMFTTIQELKAKEIEGILKQVQPDMLCIECDQKEILLPRKEIALAKAVYHI